MEITATELREKLRAEPATRPHVVDVREADELRELPFPAADEHIPLGALLGGQLPRHGGREVVTVCASGARSLTAARALRQAGVSARSLRGGAMGWSG